MQQYKVILTDGDDSKPPTQKVFMADGVDIAEDGRLLFGDDEGKIIAGFANGWWMSFEKVETQNESQLTGEAVDVEKIVDETIEAVQEIVDIVDNIDAVADAADQEAIK